MRERGRGGGGVLFAAVRLLPRWKAGSLVGALQAIDICIAAFRKSRLRKERPPMRAIASSIVFNGGQAYLSTLAAAFLLSSFGVSARAGRAGPAAGGFLLPAALTMYPANLRFLSI